MKSLYKPSSASREPHYGILNNSKLPIRKGIRPWTEDLNKVPSIRFVALCADLNEKIDVTSSVEQIYIREKVKGLISQHENKELLYHIGNFKKRQIDGVAEKIGSSIWSKLGKDSRGTQRISIKRPKNKRWRKMRSKIEKQWTEGLRKVGKKEISDLDQVATKHGFSMLVDKLTIIASRPLPKPRSRFLLCDYLPNDKETTLYGVDDTLASQSSTPTSLIVSVSHTGSDHACNDLTSPISLKRASGRKLENYEIKPACISVFEKSFPKISILCSSAEAMKDPVDRATNGVNVMLTQVNNNSRTLCRTTITKQIFHQTLTPFKSSSEINSIDYKVEEKRSYKSNVDLFEPTGRFNKFRNGGAIEMHEKEQVYKINTQIRERISKVSQRLFSKEKLRPMENKKTKDGRGLRDCDYEVDLASSKSYVYMKKLNVYYREVTTSSITFQKGSLNALNGLDYRLKTID